MNAAEVGAEARIAQVWGSAQDFACSLPMGLSPVSAGFPSPAEEYTERRLDLNAWVVHNPSSTFYLQVEGISMVKAGILPGDVLAVDRSETAVTGDIVVARIDGEDLVKRFRKTSTGIFLDAEAEDPTKYPPMHITDDRPFEIWGVVIAVARKTREVRRRGVRTR